MGQSSPILSDATICLCSSGTQLRGRPNLPGLLIPNAMTERDFAVTLEAWLESWESWLIPGCSNPRWASDMPRLAPSDLKRSTAPGFKRALLRAGQLRGSVFTIRASFRIPEFCSMGCCSLRSFSSSQSCYPRAQKNFGKMEKALDLVLI